MKNTVSSILFFAVVIVAAIVTERANTAQTQETTRIPQRTRHNPEPENEDQRVDQFMDQYAGEYIIKIEGVRSDEVEKYILKPTGECIWIWETGAYPDTKYGRWNADRNKIQTINKGRTGDVPEIFTLRNGKFRSEWGDDRVLVKVKDL